MSIDLASGAVRKWVMGGDGVRRWDDGEEEDMKCVDCGRFCAPVEWKMIYSGSPPEPSREVYKCEACVNKHGSFGPQCGIKPERSCGVMESAK